MVVDWRISKMDVRETGVEDVDRVHMGTNFGLL
jgi:hypothetical protein